MANSSLDMLKKDVARQRINGLPNGNRIRFDAKGAAKIIEYCNDMPEQVLRAAPLAERKRHGFDRAALMRRVAAGIEVKSVMQPSDRSFLGCASAEVCDLSNDV